MGCRYFIRLVVAGRRLWVEDGAVAMIGRFEPLPLTSVEAARLLDDRMAISNDAVHDKPEFPVHSQ